MKRKKKIKVGPNPFGTATITTCERCGKCITVPSGENHICWSCAGQRKKKVDLSPYLIVSMIINLALATLVCIPIQLHIGKLNETIRVEKAVNDNLREQQFDTLENISIIDENNERAAKEAYGKITKLKKENKKLRGLVDRLADLLELEAGVPTGTVHGWIKKELK